MSLVPLLILVTDICQLGIGLGSHAGEKGNNIVLKPMQPAMG
jgi:hypothetical protein